MSTVVVSVLGVGIVLAATPRLASPLHRAIKQYHDFMPGATSRKYVAAMTAGLSNAMNEQGKLTVGSARSGTDIAYKVLEHLVGFVGPWMERPPQLRHIFGCERDAAKQLLLRQQYDLVHLFSCVSLLAQRTAHCEIQGKLVFVPECSVFSAGFSCKSRTPCSSKSAANRNCIQRQETEPAFTFQHIYAYIVSVSPHLFLLENVKNILEKRDAEAQSDADWVVERFQQVGFQRVCFLFDCQSFGSIAARTRTYFLGWCMDAAQRIPQGVLSNVFAPWQTCYNSFTIQALPVERFLFFDVDKFKEALGMCPLSSLKDEKSRETDLKWKEEHCDAFRAIDCPWPPSLPEYGSMDLFEVECHGERSFFVRCDLGDRTAEMALLFMMQFPYDKTEPEFVDVNPSLGRLAARPDDAAQSVWRCVMPTLVGSGKTMARYRQKSKAVLSPVLGLECFQTIGWYITAWRLWKSSPIPIPYEHSMIVNMAGNAFSAFAAAPMFTTLPAGWGSLHKLLQTEKGKSAAEPSAGA